VGLFIFVNDLFSILQVEVTTKCNGLCLMCPRSVFRDRWISQDMDVKLFIKMIDGVRHELELVYLQGWGEPLLHSNIIDMIKYVKGRLSVGVGLTTNGVFLNDVMVERLLRSGLDVIAISFAGASKGVHDSIRVNCGFDVVLRNVKYLIGLRKVLGSNIRVIASYLMMKQNVAELPSFVRLCNGLGIDEVVINNLTYIPSRALYDCKVFSCYGESVDKGVRYYVEEARRVAKELGQRVFIYSVECGELANCPEEPTRTVFINFNGDVSPCVYTNIPIQGDEIPRFFVNRQLSVNKVVFGNVRVESLYEIWGKEAYKRFREVFRRRVELSNDLTGMFLLSDEMLMRDVSLSECCKTCYRIHNV